MSRKIYEKYYYIIMLRQYIFFTFFLFGSHTFSSEICEFSQKTSSDEVEYIEQKAIAVDDVDGHIIRIFKTETNHKNSKANCENLKVVKTDFFGISDYVYKNGTVTGYSIATYDDGSKIFSNLHGIAHTPKDQTKNGIVSLTITITGGTGKYKGVKGYGTGRTEFNPETGYSSGFTETNYFFK